MSKAAKAVGNGSPRARGSSVALRDLAKLSSVDISTVSRALNHDPRVNEQRAAQIRALADKLGYRPRPLRSRLTRSIGVLLASSEAGRLDTDFLGRIAWLAQRQLADRGLHVNLECIERSGPVRLPAVVQQNRVDGVLVGGHPPVELVAELLALKVPTVAINDSSARLNVSCVRSNPEPAIHQAILHLAARGHESFGLLLTDRNYPTTQARQRSYETALREIGIQPQPAWLVCELPREIRGGREGIRQLLQRGPLPTAILTENDWLAAGAMQELERQGLHVPQDVSIVGHDDLWICEQLEPQLTTIHRAEDELVAKAIGLLVEQIEGGDRTPQEVLVEGEMVWRQSAGPAPDRLKRLDPPSDAPRA